MELYFLTQNRVPWYRTELLSTTLFCRDPCCPLSLVLICWRRTKQLVFTCCPRTSYSAVIQVTVIFVFRFCPRLSYFGTQMPKIPLRWYLPVVQEHFSFICGRCPRASCTGTYQSFLYQIKGSAVNFTSIETLSITFVNKSHIIFRTHLQQSQKSNLTLRNELSLQGADARSICMECYVKEKEGCGLLT
jgi:hypothetical protein